MGIRGESAGVIPVLNPPAPVDRAVAAPYRAYEVCMGIRGVVSRGNSRSESTSTGRPGCGCALPGLRGRQGYQGGVSRGNFRSESASTSRPGQALAATRHKPGLRIQTRFVISRIGFTGFWRRCQASACASRVMGCSQRLLVDISICHLQVSQSVITISTPLASICLNSGSPIACEVG